jgi:hypothetical protein
MIKNEDFMKRTYLLLAVLLFTAAVSANSIYSYLGMPEEFEGVDTYGVGMGNTGYSDLFRQNASYGNPSVAATTNTVLFTSTFSTGYYKYESESGLNYRDDGAFFPGFSVMVPIKEHRFGFYGRLATGGNLENQLSRTFTVDSDPETVTEIHRLQANIFEGDFFYAWANPLMNVGIAVNYYVGNRSRYIEQDYESSSYLDTKYETDHYYQNPGFTLGVSRKFDRWSLGATYASKVKLIGKTNYVTIFSSNVLDDGEFTLPHRFDFGATYKLSEPFKCSLEGGYDLWADTPSYTDSRNTARAAFGLSYDPTETVIHWYEKVPVRAGLQYRQLPFESNGSAIDELTCSAGFSLPLKSTQRQVSIALQYIARGTTSSNEVDDRTFLVSISAVGFDVFAKRKKMIEHRDIPMPDESTK